MPRNIKATSSKQETSTGSPSTMYLVTAVISERKECFSDDNVESKAFVSKNDARAYMDKRAKTLYCECILGQYYDDKKSIYDYKQGRGYYYNKDRNSIDFGCEGEGYRSHRETWGFVRMEKMVVHPTGAVVV